MKGVCLSALVVVLTFCLDSPIAAQRVRLRSNINPPCATEQNSKFADIYGDGNIAVQGSYSCRGVFIYD
ncbi:MAG: hypothetical protein LC734_05340, partial [Acidobacteria bacterium]|nr:hypothetical protein [Acidobacteriota bacterium]